MFGGVLDFLLFLIATLAGLAFAYILFLLVAASIRGESGDVTPVLLGLALWGGISALAWMARSRLRSMRENQSDGN